MVGHAARFAAIGIEHVNLAGGIVAAAGEKRDLPAVGRPARAGFAALSERELHLAAAIGANAVDMAHAPVGFPVGPVHDEQNGRAVRRQLRVLNRRQLDHVDDAEGPLFLREQGCFERDEEGEGENGGAHRGIVYLIPS